MQNADNLIINESNFNQYFFDLKTHKPQKGEVIAKYTANADFIEGNQKLNVIDLIQMPDKAKSAVAVMKNIFHASEPDSVRVPREMLEDLMLGLSSEDVNKKVYEFQIEYFYYTKLEYIPKDDPHWSCITLLNLDEFVENVGSHEIRSKIKYPDKHI